MNSSREDDFESVFSLPGKEALQFGHSLQSHKFDHVRDQVSAPQWRNPLQWCGNYQAVESTSHTDPKRRWLRMPMEQRGLEVPKSLVSLVSVTCICLYTDKEKRKSTLPKYLASRETPFFQWGTLDIIIKNPLPVV